MKLMKANFGVRNEPDRRREWRGDGAAGRKEKSRRREKGERQFSKRKNCEITILGSYVANFNFIPIILKNFNLVPRFDFIFIL